MVNVNVEPVNERSSSTAYTLPGLVATYPSSMLSPAALARTTPKSGAATFSATISPSTAGRIRFKVWNDSRVNSNLAANRSS